MNVIFLDIDGVIVPDHLKKEDEAFNIWNPWSASPFSKAAMTILNNIIMTTSAKIVISSDWRVIYPLGNIKEIFVEAGILYGADTIIGFTNRIKSNKNHKEKRGMEILEWVHLHRPKNWVAIDDLDLLTTLNEDHFVRCFNTKLGINAPGKKREIEIKLGN